MVSRPNVICLPSPNSVCQSLPFQKVKHVINTQDAQPSTNGGIVILITGQLLVCRVPDTLVLQPVQS